MPISINDVSRLREYINGVMDRASHHAANVENIGLAVIGAVLWRSDELEVRGQGDDMKNVLWFSVGDDRYALSYNHEAKTIEVRNRNLRGKTIQSFDNSTRLSEVRSFFGNL